MPLQLDDDPNLPSLSYQADEHVLLDIPWTPHKLVAFGIGFSSSAAANAGADPGDVFRRPALSSMSQMAYRFESAEGKGFFRESSTNISSPSYEHVNFSGTLSAGNKLFNASVRGAYAKDVYANRDVRCPIYHFA